MSSLAKPLLSGAPKTNPAIARKLTISRYPTSHDRFADNHAARTFPRNCGDHEGPPRHPRQTLASPNERLRLERPHDRRPPHQLDRIPRTQNPHQPRCLPPRSRPPRHRLRPLQNPVRRRISRLIWAIDQMRQVGVQPDGRVARRFQLSMQYAVGKALRRGIKRLPEPLVQFVPKAA